MSKIWEADKARRQKQLKRKQDMYGRKQRKYWLKTNTAWELIKELFSRLVE